MALKELHELNLSHNNLSGLLHLISSQIFNKSSLLQTLILVGITDHHEESIHDWLIVNLKMLFGLEILDVSQNSSILVDKLLSEIQTSPILALQTLCAAGCSASEQPEPISKFAGNEGEDGLASMIRLDLSGSLLSLDQMKLVTESTALC